MSTILKWHIAILFFKKERQEKILPLFYHYAKKATNMRCISLSSFHFSFHPSVFRMKSVSAHFTGTILTTERIIHETIPLTFHHRSMIPGHHFSAETSPLKSSGARLIRSGVVSEGTAFFDTSKVAIFLQSFFLSI